jgi:predicted DNA-binding transcriptional regulator YafY
MYQPATRLLTVLELLQSRPCITGRELAERLEVSGRTVRRYVTMLQDLGIPVEAERGPQGAYRLAAGFRLPPLMFTEDEALALVLGLRVTQRLNVPVEIAAAEGALAKVERVLPTNLRARWQAVEDSLIVYARTRYPSPAAPILLTLITGVRERRRVRLNYQDWRGEATERQADLYGVVYFNERWFAPGYCHLRKGRRTFRLDRVTGATLETEAFIRPADCDPLAQVIESLATSPGAWSVEVILDMPLADVRLRVPPEMATLDETPGGTRLRCNVQNLDWIALELAGLGCDLTIHHPLELRDALARLARHAGRLARLASLGE